MYSVRWVRSALNELSDLWLNADSAQRERITSATSEMDEQLRRSPEAVGESRPGGRRILFAPPLGVHYIVKADDRIVLVTHVWLFRRRSE